MNDFGLAAQKRAKGVRRGRRTAALGMFVLCVAFFLPQVQSCGSPVVPYRSVREDAGFALFCLPFFFGAGMLIVYVLRALVRSARFRRGLAHVVCLLSFAALFFADLLLWSGVRENLSSLRVDLSSAVILADVAVVGAGALGVMAIWGLAPSEAWIAACAAIGGLASLGYFLSFAGMAAWGLWVSMAGSALMAGGAAWEARAAWRSPPVPAGEAEPNAGSSDKDADGGARG
jgi:hypothetical protein